MHACRLLALGLLLIGTRSMAIDLAPLWNFDQPAQSEQRFRAALATASGDDALILQTQIARSYGLRRDFEKARQILESIEPQLERAGFEARTRHALELGRSYASAAHPQALQTPANQALARAAFQQAQNLAKAGQLDGLAVDALHMMAFVDTAPSDQLRWDQAALAQVESSTQPAAKAWEGSIRNNIGYALHQLGRYPEALDEFQHALAVRERSGHAGAIRIARWMVAWTLRALKRIDEALSIQLQLEREWQSAGAPDPYVFEELELLYRAKGDDESARRYAALRKTAATEQAPP